MSENVLNATIKKVATTLLVVGFGGTAQIFVGILYDIEDLKAQDRVYEERFLHTSKKLDRIESKVDYIIENLPRRKR